jgi:hypothetical protein
MSGYESTETEDGNVIQAGVFSGDGPSAPPMAMGRISKCVIKRVYYQDDPSWATYGGESVQSMYADVRVYGERNADLPRVLVAQPVAGLFDEDIYEPRETMQDVDGGPVQTEGQATGVPPTPAERLDGDHRLLAFIDNNPATPVVLPFGITHPRARNLRSKAGAARRVIRINGTSIEWDRSGNFTVDAQNAVPDALGPKGMQVAQPQGGTVSFKTRSPTGTVALTLDPSGKTVVDAPSIELGAGATEPVLKGAAFLADLYTCLSTIAGATMPPTTTAVQTLQGQQAKWVGIARVK